MQDRLGQRQWPCAVYLNPTVHTPASYERYDIESRIIMSEHMTVSVWFKNWKQKMITGNTTPKTTQDHDLWYLNELLQKNRVAEWCVFWNIISTIQILGADTDRELRLTVLREHTRTWCWPSSVDDSWKQPTNWHLAQSALRNVNFLHGAKPTT